MKIDLPEDLGDIGEILKFTTRLQSISDSDTYVFDFGRSRWFPPFSMLVLAMALRTFRNDHPSSKRLAENHDRHSYASHMGFFRLFKLQHGNEPGEAPGGHTYVPLSEISVGELRQIAMETGHHAGDIIEKKSSELAGLLLREGNGDLFDTVSYSIREIMRNVVEHSGSESIFICGQYWPAKGEVEIGIADEGCGISTALKGNPSLVFTDSRQALQLALMPGISGNPRAGKGRSYDHWQNSGYGLYMTSRLCRTGGDFLLCSDDIAVALDESNRNFFIARLNGTAIRLRLKVSSISDLKSRLYQFSTEGAEAAKAIRGSAESGPSVASKMLARDFKRE